MHLNSLTGPLPSVLGSTKLQELVVASNKLTSTIPTAYGQLPLLRQYFFERNSFRGSIPSALGSLLDLEYLSMDYNM